MNPRILWPIAGLFGLAILAVSFNSLTAQQRERPPIAMAYMPGQVGRYTVAHATDKQVLVLDTSSGKVYKVGADDFLKASELPKMDMPLPGPGPIERDKDRPLIKEKDARPIDKEKREERKEREERKDREEKERREREEKERKEREEKTRDK